MRKILFPIKKRSVYLFGKLAGVLVIIFSIVFLAPLVSCKHNRLKVNTSDIKLNIEVVDFDNMLFNADTTHFKEALTEIHDKYPDFFNLFTYRIIRVGGINDDNFLGLMRNFITDTMILNVNKLVATRFSDFSKTEEKLNQLFKHYHFYFPKKPLPTIYIYTSGFNQSIVTAENIVGVSLDKYLGPECLYYKMLSSTPAYKAANMYKAKIPSDVAYAWGASEFTISPQATTLLDNMIHQGKLMYFVDAMLPDEEDTVKIGFTREQLKWCKNNEAEMWRQLIHKKMLFSNQRMDIIRYINPAPSTSGFPLESPGRTGVWLGWQIVRKYMEKFPEITVSQLMSNNNYQQILNDSEYFPE